MGRAGMQLRQCIQIQIQSMPLTDCNLRCPFTAQIMDDFHLKRIY